MANRFDKLVIVTRKTRLEGLIERFNTTLQAKFWIESAGGDFSLYVKEHDTYRRALEKLQLALNDVGKIQMIERGFLPNFLFAPSDLVITVGIDGLVVNTAKYLDGQPIIAVNPDPEHVDGVLLPFDAATAPAIVRAILNGKVCTARDISMAEATLKDGQKLTAFNDLFIGVKNHYSARYSIAFGGKREHHSSSGILVATGAGSTGWLSSTFNMAGAMAREFAGKDATLNKPQLSWEDRKLVFVVREPFISKTTGADIVCGVIDEKSALTLTSETPENGIIFSDGVDTDFLAFNSGMEATITLSPKRTRLVTAA